MAQINPYLNFKDKAEEAFTFYKSVFGGDFTTLQRIKETPGGDKFPPREQNRIMHVALPIGEGNVLMGSDTMESMGTHIRWEIIFLSVLMLKVKRRLRSYSRSFRQAGK